MGAITPSSRAETMKVGVLAAMIALAGVRLPSAGASWQLAQRLA